MSQLSIFGLSRYHNTTRESDERKLQVYEETARFQNDKILWFMSDNQRAQGYTSNEIHEHFPGMLLTSVRRALTDISKDVHNPMGTVYDTGERRRGGFGRSVLVWQYKPFLVN